MKTNEAPEKIWINPSLDLPKLNGVIDKDSVQYVRKDVFINNVCDGIEHLLSGKEIKIMEQYIKKSDVMAEIERLHKKWEMGNYVYNELLSFLNTLEAKDVDLEKEATEFVQTKEFAESNESPVLLIAKHFFELGLNMQKAQNKNIWHPMSELPDHSCSVLMHGYSNDVWIADAVETLEKSTAQEWAYMDDVLKTLRI